MDKQYKTDREYSPSEIFRFNLKMWWLAGLLGFFCAAVLGAYKYRSLEPYLEDHLYVERTQIEAALFLSDYSEESVGERANNIMRMAKSNRAYQRFCRDTGYAFTLEEYRETFRMEQTEASDVVSLTVIYPASDGKAGPLGEEEAFRFTESLIGVIGEVAKEMTGEPCVGILDEPYAVRETVKLEEYSVSRSEFVNGVLKAVTAGFLLGVLVEVVLYSFYLILSRRPADADEIRRCLDTAVIDVIKREKDQDAALQKTALFLKEDTSACSRVCCLPVGCAGRNAADLLARSYAKEQKKTLFVDLASADGGENAISPYILGATERVSPSAADAYLDVVCRDAAAENGMTIAGNRRFAEYLDEMEAEYECIVIGCDDAAGQAQGYAAAKLCQKVFAVCRRKTVKNEMLYQMKNTADANAIAIDGVLIYEY